MFLSPAERTYLYDSLTQTPPLRPDSRLDHRFRPLEAKTAFLPASNGSARIRLIDGSECIVSVKSKVVLKDREPNLIECDVDVTGFRDDSTFVSNLKFNLADLLLRNFPLECLSLTSKYSYKLYIDCIVISHSSYPLSLLSLTCYLALKTTRLPLLISEIDDSQIEEQPTFSDDWESSRLLLELSEKEFQPPIFVTLGVIGNTLLFDPSQEEEQVLENGLILGWYNNKVITPISNINLATNSNNSNFKGLKPQILARAIAMASKYCGAIIHALDTLVEQDQDNDGTIF